MTQFLPENLLALFAPRPPPEFKPPVSELIVDRKRPAMAGMAAFVQHFEEAHETPPKPIVETKEQRKARKRTEKDEFLAYKIEQGIALWQPNANEEATTDPYRTLFVGRISYDTTESKLRREFEVYGKVTKIVVVQTKDGKPRGYAFVEYSHKSEMSAAYKKADGMKIDGRRVIVDYERGRTQKNWLPRRLGGGKGDTRRPREARAVIEAREAEKGTTTGQPQERGGDRDRERGGSRSFDRSAGRGGDREQRRDHEPRESRGYGGNREDRFGGRGGNRGENRGSDRGGDRGVSDSRNGGGHRDRGDRGDSDSRNGGGYRDRGDRGERSDRTRDYDRRDRHRGDRGDRHEQ